MLAIIADPNREASKFFSADGDISIHTSVGIQREIIDEHNWLPMAVLKAFEQSKNEALEQHRTNSSATKVTLPFAEGQLQAARNQELALLSRGEFAQAQLLDHPLAHQEFLDLAGHGHGEVVDEFDVAWDLEMGDLFPAVVPDFLLRGLFPFA